VTRNWKIKYKEENDVMVHWHLKMNIEKEKKEWAKEKMKGRTWERAWRTWQTTKRTTEHEKHLSPRGLTREEPNSTPKRDVIIDKWRWHPDIYIHQRPKHRNIQSINGNKSLQAWGYYCININEIWSPQRLKYTPTIPISELTAETYAANRWESFK